MSPTTLPAIRRATGLQGRHVLYAMLAFFGVVFAVNGLMLYHALATHSGLVAQEPYRKGLAYNERIAADERQAGLNWIADASMSAEGHLALALADADHNPITRLTVLASVGRPASSRQDLRLRLVERTPGHYRAEAGDLDAGAWLIDIEVRDEAGVPVYRLRRRLWLKP